MRVSLLDHYITHGALALGMTLILLLTLSIHTGIWTVFHPTLVAFITQVTECVQVDVPSVFSSSILFSPDGLAVFGCDC